MIKRTRSKTEISFLKAFVDHYSFLTGLVGRLNGKDGGPEDSSVGVNVILNVYIYEGCKVVNPLMFSELEETPYHNVLEGALFQCCDLLSFIAGTFDSKTLLEHNFEKSPTEFTVETWKANENDEYEWQLISKTHWSGVKWLNAAHTGDGGDRMCAGIATFICDNKTVEKIEDGQIIKIDKTEKYPQYRLRDILKEQIIGPKHPASYLG